MKIINTNHNNQGKTAGKIYINNKHKKAFTLVELIIVITILAILATIAFISFQNYTKDSRDANRVTTITNIKKGLELHVIKVSKYPSPDGLLVLTGSINGQVLNYVGEIGETISSILKTNKPLKDPLTNTNYAYGVSYDNKYYQVATITEGDIAYNPIFNTTYASNLLKAKVDGIYPGYIKYSSGGKVFIANAPSLLFSNSSGVNLLSSGTYFVLNNKSNLPYNYSGNKDESIKNIDGNKMIQEITKSQNATLTGIDITNLGESNFNTYFSGTTLESFNINGNDLSNTGAILNGLKMEFLKNNKNTSQNILVDNIIKFPTICGIGENINSITYQQSQDNKIIIKSNISNYIGCEISDYIGGGAYIAGLTNNNNDIMVIAKSDISGKKQWGYYGYNIPQTSSVTDGKANTDYIIIFSNIQDTAPSLCRDIGINWYLPAKDELNNIYINKSKLGTFNNDGYWFSTQYDNNTAGYHNFSNSYQYNNVDKRTNLYVRCSSRF